MAAPEPYQHNGVKARNKLLSGKINFIYFLFMLGSTGVAIAAIVPNKWFSWKLGFQNQLIVVGIMLRVMTECLQSVSKHFLLILEYRLCSSRLQNYESIITNNWLVSNITHRVRLTILTMIALPFVLSATYKLFIGGESTWTDDFRYDNKTYGINYPNLGRYAGFNDSIYLFTDAHSDFKLAMTNSNHTVASLNIKNAIPYGYNMLLLSNTSAAALDMPSPDYIQSIQRPLADGDRRNVNASVVAFVATYNDTLDSLREDDTFWTGVFEKNNKGFRGMTSFWLFDLPSNSSLGLMPTVPNLRESASCLLGVYPNSTEFWSGYHDSPESQDGRMFREYSMMFSVTRTRCNASWVITKTTIRLDAGSCEDRQLNPDVATDVLDDDLLAPFPLDTLPLLSKTIGFVEGKNSDSPWRMPTYVTSVVMSYWARAAFMIPLSTNKGFNDVSYSPFKKNVNEKTKSTRATLRSSPGLYIILCIQPFLGIVAYALSKILYRTPISPGFGLVSILAGIDHNTLDNLEGAGLSGETKLPVSMQIGEVNDKIVYSLEPKQKLTRHGRTWLPKGDVEYE